MKRIISVIILVLLFIPSAIAQEIDLSGMDLPELS